MEFINMIKKLDEIILLSGSTSNIVRNDIIPTNQ